MSTDSLPSFLRILAAAVLVALMLTACGGGGGGGSAGLSGQFIDEAVEGIGFSNGSRSGRTGASGSFSYDQPGDLIAFTVGDVEIGAGFAVPRMTPVDLVKDDDPAAVDETNDHVANIARFLQTIDDDGDPANGILITRAVHDAAVGMSADFDQSVAAFESDANVVNLMAALTAATTAGARGLVPLAAAQDRLRDTLNAELAECFTGTFRGTLNDQTFRGSFLFTANPDGSVTGTFGGDPLSGEIASNGAIVLTVDAPYGYSLPLTGTVSNGSVTGAWHFGFDSGTFEGSLDSCPG